MRFVGESQLFIQKRMLEIESLRKRHPDKKLISGEEFLFFGEYWPLEIVWTWGPRVKVVAGEDYLEMLAPLSSSPSERQKALKIFYKRQARLHLHERLKYFAAQMSLFPSQVSIRGQKTRWGSCSSIAGISLNWKLLAAPLEVIDYVIIHELAHIRHLNHSAKFWDLVSEVQPHWRNSRRWLKEHEFEIGVQFQAES